MRMISRKQWAVLTMATALCVALGGCAGLKTDKNASSDTAVAAPAREQRYEPVKPTSIYHDFQDVLFPVELKLDRKRSAVYVTDGFKTGMLTLSGSVDARSTVTWFENNMVKDNWHLVGSLKAQRTLLLFAKQNRYCVISVTDGMMKTHVEVWVAPTLADKGTGRLQ
ncbi:MAG: hypothetical protein SWC96_13590 [Thermodesulfobacteriota bacterium]|nr:hypothetical protein [Thermodesulfobacteriota bacterium]